MWADRCTQRPHCALCALNTNDICPSSTTGLSSGYSIKPSSPSSFLPRTLQLQIKCKSRPVRTLSQNRILVESKCFKVHIYRCQAGSSAGLRRADAVHSASTDPSYSSAPCRRCALSTNWPKLQLHRLILLQLQNVVRLSVENFYFIWTVFTGLKAEEGMLSLDGSRTAYGVHQER